jgi:hypothetical protein
MGPRKNAADAFIQALGDNWLQDRWIPDEDCIYYIQECLEKNFILHVMNMGLYTKLTFLNNRAIVNDECTVVLHNKKKVHTGKGGQKRNVHFYYVLDANQPVPLVAMNQDFYQTIWDAPQPNHRSLKQKVSQAKKASTLPTEKAKASLTRPILPESVSASQVLPSLPELFQEANRMVLEAWKVAFPRSLHFPSKLIIVFLPPANKGVQNMKLENGVVIHDIPTKYEFVVDSDLACFRRERGLVTALNDVLNQNTSRPLQHTKHLLAAFAASHPQNSIIY